MAIAFFTFVVIFLYYQIFIKKDDNWSRFHPESLPTLARYLHFGTMISIFIHVIFDINWVLWVTLYSMIGIIICFKPKEEKNEFLKKLIFISLVLLFFNVLRIPTHPDSFRDYISSKDRYQCVHTFECVKMSSITSPDNLLHTKVELLSVKGYSFDHYFLFAKGSMKLGNDDGSIEEFKGYNIAGFWIEY